MAGHHPVAVSQPRVVARRRDGLDDDRVAGLFEEWYRVYPRRVARGAALKAYARVLRSRAATPAELLDGARRVAARYASPSGDWRPPIKHPSTWLNQQCWLDEEEAPAPAITPASVPRRVSCLLAPARRLGLAGEGDALVRAVGALLDRVSEERTRARFGDADYASLMDDGELVRAYLDWLAEQGWHTATLAVLRFESPAFSQFRRETALADQFGRDPITRRSRFSEY